MRGIATFNGIVPAKVGTYTLKAVSVSLTSAISNPFNVIAGQPAQLAFRQQPTTTIAGTVITPAVTVVIQDASGNTITNATNAITIAMVPAVSGNPMPITVNAVNGVATFSGIVPVKVGSYTLKATSVSLTAAVSNTFAVIAGQAAKLAFRQQPTNTAAGMAISPAVTVVILDALGNVVASATNVVTITALPEWGGAAIPMGSVAAINGMATFSTLKLTMVGSYKLKATATNLNWDISNAFSITYGAAAQVECVVSVIVRDASGNIIVTSATPNYLPIGTINPITGSLSINWQTGGSQFTPAP